MGPEDPQGWCSRPGPIDDLQLRGAGPEGVRGFGGISADPKVRGESVEAFGANLAGAVGDRRVFLDAAKGVSEADLAPLRVLDTRHTMYFDPETHQALTNQGVLAAAAWAHGPLAGARVAIDGGGDGEVSLARAALAEGARVVALGGRTLASGFDAEVLDAGG